ncbi:hypothetical protein [Chitinophaga sp. Cy-1792]|uniref:hypothetical protein n=1 Tax=Chitinophaga sp. Cy-1792 TaxID=2608339 RepID=UPI00141EE6FA|nr:hypothetical protein [Chitinophaga sp. Cy-1792]NIG55979.1 hypothetical protein [Chitinophaga sp. Cy-1792]
MKTTIPRILGWLTGLVFSVTVQAQVIPATGKVPADFVPAGWKIVVQSAGDLNKDNLPDIAMIITDTDKRNYHKNPDLGADTLNLNPRWLVILFQQPGGTYQLSVVNKRFIPAANDAESPCLDDPLGEAPDTLIRNGLLTVHFNYWLSCGSYESSNATYVFRYQHQHFELIGLDTESYSRASGEMLENSVNFSTGKRSYTSGGNMFEEAKNKPATRWYPLRSRKIWVLDNFYADDLPGISEL